MNISLRPNSIYIDEKNEKSIDIDIDSYDELMNIKDNIIKQLNGDSSYCICIYSVYGDEFFNKSDDPHLSWALEWCRYYDCFGNVVLDDFENMDMIKRVIVDDNVGDKHFNISDIVYCECDKNFHVIVDMDEGIPILSDFKATLYGLYEITPSAFIHKVPNYIIDYFNLGVLRELSGVKNNEDKYFEVLELLKKSHPWIKL